MNDFSDPGRPDFPYGHMGESEHDMETWEDRHQQGCGSQIERALWALFILGAAVVVIYALLVFFGGIH